MSLLNCEIYQRGRVSHRTHTNDRTPHRWADELGANNNLGVEMWKPGLFWP